MSDRMWVWLSLIKDKTLYIFMTEAGSKDFVEGKTLPISLLYDEEQAKRKIDSLNKLINPPFMVIYEIKEVSRTEKKE